MHLQRAIIVMAVKTGNNINNIEKSIKDHEFSSIKLKQFNDFLPPIT